MVNYVFLKNPSSISLDSNEFSDDGGALSFWYREILKQKFSISESKPLPAEPDPDDDDESKNEPDPTSKGLYTDENTPKEVQRPNEISISPRQSIPESANHPSPLAQIQDDIEEIPDPAIPQHRLSIAANSDLPKKAPAMELKENDIQDIDIARHERMMSALHSGQNPNDLWESLRVFLVTIRY